MLPRPEAKTLAEGAFFEIKSDILRSRFPPGYWLRLDELRETYGISISPLREALSRLIATGLVTAEGQRGFRVAEMSSENLIDITLNGFCPTGNSCMKRAIAIVVSLPGRGVGGGTLPASIVRSSRRSWRAIPVRHHD
jgi:hypothetical protein